MKSTAPKRTILLSTRDRELRSAIGDNLVLQGYAVLNANTPDDTLSLLDRRGIDVFLLDIEKMNNQELDLVHYARTRSSQVATIVFATINELEEARNALRNGASFYLIKPVAFSDIKIVLEQVLLRIERDRAHLQLEQQVLADLMAGSPAMEKVLRLATKIAPTTSTVLIGGESGTGKEFFAKIIHRMSNRSDGQFVAMNCGAIPDTLFESELFGHRKGAFTGADRDKPGLVEEAHLGTLFLDEVGELSAPAQVKLLRFLQEQTFRHIGETNQRSVSVRIIAASNRDLYRMVDEGRFREDLFYRLNVFYLHLPPLRDRRETIPSLIKLFVHRQNAALEKHVNVISKGAELMLASYDYPGNVRELENIVEHAVVLAEGNTVTEADLPEFMVRNRLMLKGPSSTPSGSPHDTDGGPQGILTLAESEKTQIMTALSISRYNYGEAAKSLGISRSTLWRKIKSYKIAAEDPA